MMHFVVTSACIFALLEAVKGVWPGWKRVGWLKRAMPVVPIVIGILVFAVFPMPDLSIMASMPYGILAGSLSSSMYELIQKVIRQKVEQ